MMPMPMWAFDSICGYLGLRRLLKALIVQELSVTPTIARACGSTFPWSISRHTPSRWEQHSPHSSQRDPAIRVPRIRLFALVGLMIVLRTCAAHGVGVATSGDPSCLVAHASPLQPCQRTDAALSVFGHNAGRCACVAPVGRFMSGRRVHVDVPSQRAAPGRLVRPVSLPILFVARARPMPHRTLAAPTDRVRSARRPCSVGVPVAFLPLRLAPAAKHARGVPSSSEAVKRALPAPHRARRFILGVVASEASVRERQRARRAREAPVAAGSVQTPCHPRPQALSASP